jgi:hypothetical protein
MRVSLIIFLIISLVSFALAQTSVVQFGATGNGITDDTFAIQAAIDSVFAGGGGIVYFPAGTYIINARLRPNMSAYPTGIWVYSGITLNGAGQGATILKAGPNQINLSWLISNYNIGSHTDQNIQISNLTIDGNAANQLRNIANRGVCLWRVRYLTIENVKFINVRGTTNLHSNGEGFSCEITMSSDISIINCVATADANLSSTGFNTDGNSNIKYSDCTASGFKTQDGQYGMGFSGCNNKELQYINCRSYSNMRTQFNMEGSTAVAYYNCIAGGEPGDPQGRYGFTFALNSAHVQVYGGSSRGNSYYGIWLAKGANYVTLSGMDITENKIALQRLGTVLYLKVRGCQGVPDIN